jgi:small conductance mechanosensitive channel
MVDIQNSFSIVTDKLEGWLTAAVKLLPNLGVAILVVLAFYLIAKLGRGLVRKVDSKFAGNAAIMKLLANIVFIVILMVGMFAALSVLQLDKAVTSILAGAGIIGLAIGLAFQETASNFLAGIIMAVRKPLRLDDMIRSNDIFGQVTELNMRTTTVRTFQGQDVIIPNRLVLYNPITNYSRSGVRRLDLAVGVSYGDDLEKVKQVTIDALQSVERLDKSKDIKIWFEGFGDSSINFTAALWMNEIEQPHYRTFKSDAVMAIKQAFDDNDIMIPFPIRTLDFGIKGGEKLNEMKLNVAKSMEG